MMIIYCVVFVGFVR